MEKDYKNQLSAILYVSTDDVEQLLRHIIIKKVLAKTILLAEGDIATKLFFVLEGCLRGYYIKEDVVEVTSQFFIENQIVCSFESAMTGTPSRMYIDTIEDSVLGIILIKNLESLIRKDEGATEHFNRILISRLIDYMNLHASFILDNPEKRFRRLLHDNPELVSRLPQQYIASYLGITPVSLSRIRSRLRKQINK